MNKPAVCICAKTKAQIRSAVTVQLFSAFVFPTKIVHSVNFKKYSSLLPSAVHVLPALCQTWSETLKTSFLMMPLKQKFI